MGDLLKITDSDGVSNPTIYNITTLNIFASTTTMQLNNLDDPEGTLIDTTKKWEIIPINNVYVNNVVIPRNKFTVSNTTSLCKVTLDDDYEVGAYKPERYLTANYTVPLLGMMMAGRPSAFWFGFDPADTTYNAMDSHGKMVVLPIYAYDREAKPVRVVIVNDYYDNAGTPTLTPSTYFEDNFEDKDIEIKIYGGSSPSAELNTVDLMAAIKTAIEENKDEDYSVSFLTGSNDRRISVVCKFPARQFFPEIGEVFTTGDFNFAMDNVPDMETYITDKGENPSNEALDFTENIKPGDLIEYKSGDHIDYEPGDGTTTILEVIAVKKNILFLETPNAGGSYKFHFFYHRNVDLLTEESKVSVDCWGKRRDAYPYSAGTEPWTDVPIIHPKEIIEDLMIQAGLEDKMTDQPPAFDSTSFTPFDNWQNIINSNYITYNNSAHVVIPEAFDDGEDDFPEYKEVIKKLNQQHNTYLVKPKLDATANAGFGATSNEDKKFGIHFIPTDGQHTAYESSVLHDWMEKELKDHDIFTASMKKDNKDLYSKVEYKYNYREDTNKWEEASVSSDYVKDILGFERVKNIEIGSSDSTNAQNIANGLKKTYEKPNLVFSVNAWAAADYEVGMYVKIYSSDLPDHPTKSYWAGFITKKTKKGDKITYEITDWGSILNG